jgi:hypothetical protein
MPRNREIQVRFIRFHTDSTRDDILRITRLADNSNRVVYTEKSDNSDVVDILTCTHQQLLSYLYRVFWLTTLDEDPFKSVQFFIPGFPTFLVSVAALKQNTPSILDLVISTCWNWPVIGCAEYNRTPERVGLHSLPLETPDTESSAPLETPDTESSAPIETPDTESSAAPLETPDTESSAAPLETPDTESSLPVGSPADADLPTEPSAASVGSPEETTDGAQDEE